MTVTMCIAEYVCTCVYMHSIAICTEMMLISSVASSHLILNSTRLVRSLKGILKVCALSTIILESVCRKP